MYCNNCGREIDDRAAVCVHCGVPTSKQPVAGGQDATYRPIVGFILSFFLTWIGGIVSCVEYKRAKEVGGDHRFALAGIIIGFVSAGVSLLISILYIGIIAAAISEYGYIFSMFI